MAARVCFCFGHCIRLGSWPFSRLAIWSPCQRQSRRRAIFADLLIWMNEKSPSGRGSAPPPFFFFLSWFVIFIITVVVVVRLSTSSSCVDFGSGSSSSLLGAWCNSRIDSARRGHAEITGRIVSRSVYFGNQTAAAWKLKPRRAHV